MTRWYLLAYVFGSFVTGSACIGGALVLARRGERLARGFLLLYLPLTVLVLAALLLALADTVQVAPGTTRVLEYLEDVVGRYAVMLALPLFAHRVFAVPARRRDAVLAALTLAAVAAQHVTEYVLGGIWDERGDIAEDLLFGGVVLYTLWVAFAPARGRRPHTRLAKRFRWLLLLALPVLGYDLFLADGGVLRLYPLWYCAFGATALGTLLGGLSRVLGSIPAAWGLSAREEEVVRLVQRGLSREEIARQLTISPNTVKTHLSAIFDKSGLRTRAAVMATLAAAGAGAGGSESRPGPLTLPADERKAPPHPPG